MMRAPAFIQRVVLLSILLLQGHVAYLPHRAFLKRSSSQSLGYFSISSRAPATLSSEQLQSSLKDEDFVAEEASGQKKKRRLYRPPVEWTPELDCALMEGAGKYYSLMFDVTNWQDVCNDVATKNLTTIPLNEDKMKFQFSFIRNWCDSDDITPMRTPWNEGDETRLADAVYKYAYEVYSEVDTRSGESEDVLLGRETEWEKVGAYCNRWVIDCKKKWRDMKMIALLEKFAGKSTNTTTFRVDWREVAEDMNYWYCLDGEKMDADHCRRRFERSWQKGHMYKTSEDHLREWTDEEEASLLSLTEELTDDEGVANWKEIGLQCQRNRMYCQSKFKEMVVDDVLMRSVERHFNSITGTIAWKLVESDVASHLETSGFSIKMPKRTIWRRFMALEEQRCSSKRSGLASPWTLEEEMEMTAAAERSARGNGGFAVWAEVAEESKRPRVYCLLKHQDVQLTRAVEMHGDAWMKVAEEVNKHLRISNISLTPDNCRNRYTRLNEKLHEKLTPRNVAWDEEETQQLVEVVNSEAKKGSDVNWAYVGEHVKRSQHQCQQHFKKVYLDALLHEATSKYVKSHGCFDWEKISEFVNRNISVYGMERTSKQLKTRWEKAKTTLESGRFKRDLAWSTKDDDDLLAALREYADKKVIDWSDIAERLDRPLLSCSVRWKELCVDDYLLAAVDIYKDRIAEKVDWTAVLEYVNTRIEDGMPKASPDILRRRHHDFLARRSRLSEAN